MKNPYPRRTEESAREYEHRLIVAKTIGRSLRGEECVHHVDENKTNNAKSNFVVCNDLAYHRLLHLRTRALRECGDANALYCYFCSKWDRLGVNGMRAYPRRSRRASFSYHHAACRSARRRERYAEGARNT